MIYHFGKAMVLQFFKFEVFDMGLPFQIYESWCSLIKWFPIRSGLDNLFDE
jgi:hypothetical protein